MVARNLRGLLASFKVAASTTMQEHLKHGAQLCEALRACCFPVRRFEWQSILD